MTNKLRVGLFGGSFNPIHEGHLKVIKEILNKEIADELWIVPCKNHALNKCLESSKHRLNMLKLAVKNIRKVKIKDIEIKSKGKNYTINTVKRLKKMYKQHNFILIVGSDIIAEIVKWYKYKELLGEIDMFVLKRQSGDISSTKIRNNLKNRTSIKNLVPPEVNRYINQRGLYK